MAAAQLRIPLPSIACGTIQLLDLARWLKQLGAGKSGILNLWLDCPASAGYALSVNENADPTVRSDMLGALEKLAPGSPAAKALLMSFPSLSLPIEQGSLAFGTWQGVYLAGLCKEASAAAKNPELVMTVLEASSHKGFTFSAKARASHPVDREVVEALRKAEVGASPPSPQGLCLVHEKHTSASLSIANGNLEPFMRSCEEHAAWLLDHCAAEWWDPGSW
eukprot:TRINITY_DN25989_c0_g1_i1.p1 TRINITY_DN25989_c0_g1~~TRINITY_DN25989_c0_g1_i1.p1  ORF type:complete len:242 (+),score=46.56 TRINITY_DN25989_c0_g1_i1:66-728(+)